MVSRLTRQKGLDLLIYIIDELMANDVQLVVWVLESLVMNRPLRKLRKGTLKKNKAAFNV